MWSRLTPRPLVSVLLGIHLTHPSAFLARRWRSSTRQLSCYRASGCGSGARTSWRQRMPWAITSSSARSLASEWWSVPSVIPRPMARNQRAGLSESAVLQRCRLSDPHPGGTPNDVSSAPSKLRPEPTSPHELRPVRPVVDVAFLDLGVDERMQTEIAGSGVSR